MTADPSKLKCETNDAMEALNYIRNCFTENYPDLKNLKNDGDINKCKTDAKVKITQLGQDPNVMKVGKCMFAKKRFIENNDPADKCTGFE